MDANEHGNYIDCANVNYCQNNNLISFRRVPSINSLLCLPYIIAPILIGTLKLVPLILSFVSQSNLFILISVLGIKNSTLNKAEGDFESISFDITTSLSTQKICFTTASLLSQPKVKYIFFFFNNKAQISVRLWSQYSVDESIQKILHSL